MVVWGDVCMNWTVQWQTLWGNMSTSGVISRILDKQNRAPRHIHRHKHAEHTFHSESLAQNRTIRGVACITTTASPREFPWLKHRMVA